MPQMKPMNWKLTFLMLIMTMFSFLYYNFFPQEISTTKSNLSFKKKLNNSAKNNFKW